MRLMLEEHMRRCMEVAKEHIISSACMVSVLYTTLDANVLV